MSGQTRIGILGATGVVGQRLIQLLDGHPQFTVTALAASDRSQHKPFGRVCTWRLSSPMPDWAAPMVVQPPSLPLDCDVVLSSLPAQAARDTEPAFASAGYPVVTNSSAHRMDDDVPLVIPEVNPEHLCVLESRPGSGWIVANPNCSAVMVALVLTPLHARFGVDAVSVSTMQALSGAGYPGVAALDITDNIIPYIPGEEEKLEAELGKLLGTVSERRFVPASFPVSAQCHRVPVQDGHLAAMWVHLRHQVPVTDVREALASFTGRPQELRLHTAPPHPIVVRDEPDRPQPRLDRDAGSGMTVTVGRLRQDKRGGYRLVALSHNTIRGAAGAAVLNAELLLATGMLDGTTVRRRRATLG